MFVFMHFFHCCHLLARICMPHVPVLVSKVFSIRRRGLLLGRSLHWEQPFSVSPHGCVTRHSTFLGSREGISFWPRRSQQKSAVVSSSSAAALQPQQLASGHILTSQHWYHYYRTVLYHRLLSYLDWINPRWFHLHVWVWIHLTWTSAGPVCPTAWIRR